MDQLTSIIVALGLDKTFFVQLVVFLVGYVALTQVVFKPYFAAFIERKKRTVGNEETAERLINETEQLKHEYEKKAREINSNFKVIFDRSRSDALREYDKVVSEARDTAKAVIEKAREEISKEMETARNQLEKEAPEVANSIASKIIGKEVQV